MTKQKLLFVAPTTSLQAGGELSNLTLMLAVKRRGYKLHVVVRGSGELTNELAKHSIPYSIVPFGYWNVESFEVTTGHADMKAIVKIQEVISQLKVDCVVTNTLNMPWGALAAAVTNTPHVWIVREFPFEEFTYLHSKYEFIKQFSNLVIANSKMVADYMNVEYQMNAKYFYSYVNTRSMHLAHQTKPPQLVNVGHIFQRKNQIELIKAAAILHKQGKLKNQILLIGGDYPEYKKRLMRLIKKNHLEKFVKFAGYKKNPFSLVQPNDILVQTSLSESVGRTIVEAMKLGIITIGADIPGTEEAVHLGGGVLYKTGNARDLATKIEQVLANPKHYHQVAIATKKNANKNLSESACHQNFFTELEKIFGQPNPQNHLQHLLPHLVSNVGYVDQNDKEIKNYQYHLNGILQSKSWRLVLITKKFFKR
jgi:glycosyltransferase involved in cell wall biosynthesis